MKAFSSLYFAAALLSTRVGAQSDDDHDAEVDDMGPAAFMWPEDREWLSYHDNVAPCGTSAGPTNRTDFPLTGGAIALVQQEESFDVEVSISYSHDPQTNDDFEVLISAQRLKELDPGHKCVPISNPPSDVTEGSNATLQIQYISQFDNEVNETFYACADIVYVPANLFTTTIPCFNATEPEPEETNPSGSSPESSEGDGSGNEGDSSPSNGGGSGGLSKGAIAGIVIGVVVGVAAIALALFFLYRRDQREKRVADHTLSNRNVQWDENAAAAAKTRNSGTESAGSVPLQDLEGRR